MINDDYEQFNKEYHNAQGDKGELLSHLLLVTIMEGLQYRLLYSLHLNPNKLSLCQLLDSLIMP